MGDRLIVPMSASRGDEIQALVGDPRTAREAVETFDTNSWILSFRFTIGIGELSTRLADLPGAPSDGASGSAAVRVGILDRLLVFLLIMVGEWSVIGFVIAAKSIARFRELEDRKFTDYYLAGTFTSLLMAIVTGLAAVWPRGIMLPV